MQFSGVTCLPARKLQLIVRQASHRSQVNLNPAVENDFH